MRAPSIRMWTAVTLLLAAGPAVADIVTLEPSQDNTLCQDPGGALSNGAGEFFFAGRTLQGTNSIRRGLLAFDVAGAIPGPALIQSAQLNLVMTMSIAGPVPVELRRVTNLWGEGPSNAPGQEGACTTAQAGDATWLHTFWPVNFWNTTGGDFSATVSATQMVAGAGSYTWGSTPQMVADVQSWLDNPATNFGWLVLADESTAPTAKRFNSRESPAGTRPLLTLEFMPVIFADGFESGDTSAWSQVVP